MRNRYVLFADVVLIAVVAFVAFALRFDFRFLSGDFGLAPFVSVALLVKPLVFFLFGMYSRYWRYATLHDMLVVSLAVATASLFFAAVMIAGVTYDLVTGVSRAVFLIDAALTFIATVAVRVGIRVAGETRAWRRGLGAGGERSRVLIVGAGDAGAIVTREMQRNLQLGMQPVGFLDDDPVKIGNRINRVPVVGPLSQLPDVVRTMQVDQVIIAMPKVAGSVVRGVAEDCRRTGVASRTIPGVFELLGGSVSVGRLRPVEITDLLRRSPAVRTSDSNSYLQDRTVLVTGAGGSIGFELCRQVAHSRPRRLALLGHGENSIFDAYGDLRDAFPYVRIVPVIADIRDRGRMFQVFDSIQPDIVFHAAAHKHVPLMEDNPEEAISNNVLGTRNTLDAAIRVGVDRLVMISSDKAVNPSNIMGASKRVAEALVHQAAIDVQRPFVVVRFGNVLGSRGSVVPIFKKQIENGGPLTITHPDMKRFFMTIPEAAHLVLQAAGLGQGADLFVLNMGEPLRVVQLAEDLVRLSGLTPEDVGIVFTGLRSGEKLEESLWEAGALIEDTTHPEVLKVMERRSPHDRPLAASLATLKHAASQGDRVLMDLALRELVPSFSPASRVASRTVL